MIFYLTHWNCWIGESWILKHMRLDYLWIKRKVFFKTIYTKYVLCIWNMDIHTPSKGVNFLWLFRFSVFMPNTSDGHVESWKGNLLKWGNCFYQPTMHTAWKCARNVNVWDFNSFFQEVYLSLKCFVFVSFFNNYFFEWVLFWKLTWHFLNPNVLVCTVDNSMGKGSRYFWRVW